MLQLPLYVQVIVVCYCTYLVFIQCHQSDIFKQMLNCWIKTCYMVHKRKYLCWDLLIDCLAQTESGFLVQLQSQDPLQSFPLGLVHCGASFLYLDTQESPLPAVYWGQVQLWCRLSVKERTYRLLRNSLRVQKQLFNGRKQENYSHSCCYLWFAVKEWWINRIRHFFPRNEQHSSY